MAEPHTMREEINQDVMYRRLIRCGFNEKYAKEVAERLPQFLASLRLIGIGIKEEMDVQLSLCGDIELYTHLNYEQYGEFLANTALILYDNQRICFCTGDYGEIVGIMHYYNTDGNFCPQMENDSSFPEELFLEVHKKKGTKPIKGRRY